MTLHAKGSPFRLTRHNPTRPDTTRHQTTLHQRQVHRRAWQNRLENTSQFANNTSPEIARIPSAPVYVLLLILEIARFRNPRNVSNLRELPQYAPCVFEKHKDGDLLLTYLQRFFVTFAAKQREKIFLEGLKLLTHIQTYSVKLTDWPLGRASGRAEASTYLKT